MKVREEGKKKTKKRVEEIKRSLPSPGDDADGACKPTALTLLGKE